jgi:hypothetical protein
MKEGARLLQDWIKHGDKGDDDDDDDDDGDFDRNESSGEIDDENYYDEMDY